MIRLIRCLAALYLLFFFGPLIMMAPLKEENQDILAAFALGMLAIQLALMV